MSSFCSSCGTELPANAVFCPSCGKSQGQAAGGGPVAPPAASAAGGLSDNLAGMLAYVTPIPAIVFLVMEPYKRNRFIRFHSLQSIFLCAALIALAIALSLLLAFVPLLGLVVWPLVCLGAFIVWIVLLLKAYQGQMFKLPVIGELADKNTGAA